MARPRFCQRPRQPVWWKAGCAATLVRLRNKAGCTAHRAWFAACEHGAVRSAACSRATNCLLTARPAGLIANLTRIDRQLLAIARHRMRSGERPRSLARYRALIVRVRAMLKTRINAALNRIVDLHAPAELRVEWLNLRAPGLSRRLNRLITN